jgi:hypothetical protein
MVTALINLHVCIEKLKVALCARQFIVTYKKKTTGMRTLPWRIPVTPTNMVSPRLE